MSITGLTCRVAVETGHAPAAPALMVETAARAKYHGADSFGHLLHRLLRREQQGVAGHRLSRAEPAGWLSAWRTRARRKKPVVAFARPTASPSPRNPRCCLPSVWKGMTAASQTPGPPVPPKVLDIMAWHASPARSGVRPDEQPRCRHPTSPDEPAGWAGAEDAVG